MTSELSDKEKQDLKDIEKFNAEIGQPGWHIEDKLIEELDISGIALNQSSLKEVEFSNVTGRDARFTSSELKKVKFSSGDFSNSLFTDVRFIECEFAGVIFEKSIFENCTFTDCKSVRAKMSDAVLRKCTFTKCADDSGIFTRAEFTNTMVLKSDWHNTSLYHATFRSSEITDGTLELVVFGNANIEDLKIATTNIVSGSFGEATIKKLLLEKCNSKSVSFGKARISQLTITGCDDFNGLNIVNSDCQLLTIEGCDKMLEPKIYISRVDSLTIRSSNLAYLYCVESVFGSGGEISKCKIAGANLQGAQMTGLTIRESEFSDYLVISNGTFKNLALAGVTYSEGIEIDSQDVDYIESDRFAPK